MVTWLTLIRLHVASTDGVAHRCRIALSSAMASSMRLRWPSEMDAELFQIRVVELGQHRKIDVVFGKRGAHIDPTPNACSH